ncbi:hypothetical protein EVAR_69156_1 [Eumeta japonica]|uniref:Uncharacterized protein n=1 Tax=Eumeta variegata TaxID=151549 RepID=A0A4C1TAE5_EUMVA|nr:hypothetical protein EVAR_69156_1 [Eumeta japonica]
MTNVDNPREVGARPRYVAADTHLRARRRRGQSRPSHKLRSYLDASSSTCAVPYRKTTSNRPHRPLFARTPRKYRIHRRCFESDPLIRACVFYLLKPFDAKSQLWLWPESGQVRPVRYHILVKYRREIAASAVAFRPNPNRYRNRNYKWKKEQKRELRLGEIETTNGIKIEIECGTKIRIKSVTGIGIRNGTEIKIDSGSETGGGIKIGISLDQEQVVTQPTGETCTPAIYRLRYEGLRHEPECWMMMRAAADALVMS